MARNKFTSPTLALDITDANRQQAIESHSGGCLIADAIKRQYPHLTGITVDMATVRASDRAKGERYVYLTPPAAQHVLLAFDQGWRVPTESVVIKRAVQVTPIKARSRAVKATRQERLAELEALEAEGAPMTRQEKAALTRVRKVVDRPTTEGKPEVKVVDGGSNHGVVVRGGRPPVQGPAHPNLLRGRNRHFGAKLADPGKAFEEAVEKGIAARQQQSLEV
jgi:hypothetical protein